MFFLIPLGIAAVSALSTSTIVGGAAVASTALALGLKHAADRIEEKNIRVVQQVHQDSKEMISAFQTKVNANKSSYKAKKINELNKHIALSDMNKSDKERYFAQLNTILVKK